MKKCILVCFMMISFYFGFFGNQLMNVHAEDNYMPEKTRYFTSIQIQQGETLWEIASRFSTGSDLTVQSYMDELIKMNNLQNDTIYAGQYLTVVYFAD